MCFGFRRAQGIWISPWSRTINTVSPRKMKQFLADSNYHQFYVADREFEPEAPTEWTDANVAARHLTMESISALCPESDIDARITSCGPNDPEPSFPDRPDFELITSIKIPSGRVGIYGWPWELEDEYDIGTLDYEIFFQGFAIDKKDDEEDYYYVRVRPKGG
jgi:hypothetical protein